MSIRLRILKDEMGISYAEAAQVSQVSIRLRILKGVFAETVMATDEQSFTGVDPFEDTERKCG